MEKTKGQKSSFEKAELIIVNCCKCDDRLTIDGDSYGCYTDKDEAIYACKMNDWEVEGDLAICDLCVQLEKLGISRYFTGTLHAFSGKVTVTSVDEEKNKLHVICSKNGSNWDEEFNLQHTIWGFKHGEYVAVEG